MNSIEISINMETDAIKFYEEAAGKTAHPAGKKMFLSIAEDEKRHLEMLSCILKGLDIHYKDASPMQNMKTIFESLKENMMQRIAATNDELEAFKVAMKMETEGLEFYRNLLSQVNSDKEKQLFEKLIYEEQQHYDMFANTYAFLSDTGNWFMWNEHSIIDGGTPWA